MRKDIIVCDQCGAEVGNGSGAVLRTTFADAKRGAKLTDFCDTCADALPGRLVKRRGRRPKA